MTLEARFLAKVQITATCHLWTASLNNKSRPVIRVGGRAGSMKLASHVAWFLHYGVWPVQQLNHTSCDNGLCVRWDHLYEGTQAQNGADFAARQTATCCRSGRHLRTKANTYIRPDGTRLCRDCQSITDANRQPRKRL